MELHYNVNLQNYARIKGRDLVINIILKNQTDFDATYEIDIYNLNDEDKDIYREYYDLGFDEDEDEDINDINDDFFINMAKIALKNYMKIVNKNVMLNAAACKFENYDFNKND